MSLPPTLNTVPPDFSSLLSSETFEVVAESGRKHFFVHGDILEAQSEPLRSTKSVWKETKIDLSDWDGDTVGRFVEYLYIGNYRFPKANLETEVAKELDVGARGDGAGTPDTVQSLVDQERLGRNRDMNVLLVHAKLYALAQSKDIESLEIMALERLSTALEEIDGSLPVGASGVTAGIIELLEYVYFHMDIHMGSHTDADEPMRDLVSTFVSRNFKALMCQRDMGFLLSKGGDFVVEVMGKVAKRLCDSEFCGLEGNSTMEGELQAWKDRSAASDERILQLEIANEKKVRESEAINLHQTQQLDIANTKMRQLEEVSTDNIRQLEVKIQQLGMGNSDLKKSNTEKVKKLEEKVRELEAINSKLQQSDTTNADKTQKLEAKIKQLEAANVEKAQQIEGNKAKMLQSEVAIVERLRQSRAALTMNHTEKVRQLEAIIAEKVAKIAEQATQLEKLEKLQKKAW